MIEKLSANAFSAGHAQMIAQMKQMQAEATDSKVALATELPQTASLSIPSFSAVLEQTIGHVDNLQHVAADKQRAVDMGTSDDLMGAMLESQKASVAFSAMVQVRNKINTAFDEVINISM